MVLQSWSPDKPRAIPSAEIGLRCAGSISPDRFQPLVKRVCDDIYELLMRDVENYLCANSEFNIAERIDVAERQAQQLRVERDALRSAVEYAHANGFEWPSDPVPASMGGTAIAGPCKCGACLECDAANYHRDMAIEQAREAIDQALDDMGEAGLCVCPATKKELQDALVVIDGPAQGIATEGQGDA